MQTTSTHNNPDINQRLTALGIRDRNNWDIVSCDLDEYTAAHIVVCPNLILKRKTTGEHIIVSFKSRTIGKQQHPTNYEATLISIESIVLERYFEVIHGFAPTIAMVILYGNNEKRAILYNDQDKTVIKTIAEAWARKHKKAIAGSKLAQIISGADFSNVSEEKRKAGIDAHEALNNPKPK